MLICKPPSFLSILLLVAIALYTSSPLSAPEQEDFLDFIQICKLHGYQAEAHSITTIDNYRLTIHRIPSKHSRGIFTRPDRTKVVYMQHGILDSSQTFLNNGPGLAPAFLLSDAGFDVWVGNSRGSFHSRSHTTLSPEDDPEYWDFSFVEMGRYDLPASIDYVLAQTGASKLTYIGHSQGTTQMFLSLSERPDWWKERLHSFVALAPVCKLTHSRSSFLHAVAHAGTLRALNAAGINSFLPRNKLSSHALSQVCNIAPQLCQLPLYFVSDGELASINQDKIEVFFSHYPSGTSLKAMRHFAQLLDTDAFNYYDYKDQENKLRYGTSQVPSIDLSSIPEIPIALFVGRGDLLGTIEDAKWLKSELGARVQFYKQTEGGHISFLLGEDMSYFERALHFIDSKRRGRFFF